MHRSQEMPLRYSSATLGSGNLRSVVRLPSGEDANEWIAVNIMDFFNQVNMLYGTIIDVCTSESCPRMTAGTKHEYFWSDGRQTLTLPARTYIDYLLTWVHDQLDDENVFPTQIGRAFPSDFRRVAESIMKRLIRIYAHIYHHHMENMEQLKAIEHFNTSFKHFMLFVQEFALIPDARQLAPVQELVERLAPVTNRQ